MFLVNMIFFFNINCMKYTDPQNFKKENIRLENISKFPSHINNYKNTTNIIKLL